MQLGSNWLRGVLRRATLVAGLLALALPALSAGPAVSAAAKPNATLTVQLVPGAVSAGQPALAVALFHNVGPVKLPNVVVDLHFSPGLAVGAAPGCTPVSGSKVDVVCSFGDVASGGSRKAYVTARVSKELGQAQKVNVHFSLRVGPGRPQPIITGASAKVLASNNASSRGSCVKAPRTISATLDGQVTALPSPPVASAALGVPCTPLSVGVEPKPANRGYNTNIASVGLPSLVRPAIVKLTFPNEKLPDENMIDNLPPGTTPSFDNPNPLWRLDPKTGKRFVVPRCKPGPTFPQGWHSCIIHVHAIDTNGDFDQGWITLLVQGSGFGDPRYIA